MDDPPDHTSTLSPVLPHAPQILPKSRRPSYSVRRPKERVNFSFPRVSLPRGQGQGAHRALPTPRPTADQDPPTRYFTRFHSPHNSRSSCSLRAVRRTSISSWRNVLETKMGERIDSRSLPRSISRWDSSRAGGTHRPRQHPRPRRHCTRVMAAAHKRWHRANGGSVEKRSDS